MTTPDPILRTELAGLSLASPVILAAGTSGTLDEIAEVLDLSRVGALVTKSITPEPREGNPPPRVVPLEVGMLNAIGLANPGIERFAAEHAPRAGSLACPVIGSIAGFSVEDYAAVARTMGDLEGIAAIEVNVSCPNVHGGTEFGADPVALRDLLQGVRPCTADKPMLVKLSPITVGTPASAADLARVAIESGANALTLCNTVPAMSIDVDTRRPVLTNVTGGLSGPAVRPVVTKIIHDVHTKITRDAGVPIVGVGGVSGWRSAAELILAGASAVQTGASLLASPRVPLRIAKGLAKWAHAQGVGSIADLTGALRT